MPGLSLSSAFGGRQKIKREFDKDEWWAQKAAIFPGTWAQPFTSYPKYQFTLQSTAPSVTRINAGPQVSKNPKATSPDAILATLYWDNAAGDGNGVGGSASWANQSDGRWSTTISGDATLTSAATTDAGIFDGTAGTISLQNDFTLASWTFNTTNYVLTANNGSIRTLTGSMSLASNVTLQFNDTSTALRTVAVGSISGAAGSQVRLNALGTTNATRLYISTTNAEISVPITFVPSSGTAGFGAIVGNAAGTKVSGAVTGNGATMVIGAQSGSSLEISGAINNGSAAVRIGLDTNGGGAGVVILSSTSNTWGATELNNLSSGILRMGVNNALPTGTTLTFGAANAGNSIVELNGKDTTIGQLTNGSTAGGILRNTSATAATLTISGSDTSATAFSGSLQDGLGGGTLSLTRSGTGKTILSGTKHLHWRQRQ